MLQKSCLRCAFHQVKNLFTLNVSSTIYRKEHRLWLPYFTKKFIHHVSACAEQKSGSNCCRRWRNPNGTQLLKECSPTRVREKAESGCRMMNRRSKHLIKLSRLFSRNNVKIMSNISPRGADGRWLADASRNWLAFFLGGISYHFFVDKIHQANLRIFSFAENNFMSMETLD